jgi:hypothetical protein
MAWVGLCCNVIAMLNQKPGTGTGSAGFSAVSFSVLGIVMLYSQMYFAPRSASIFTRTK